MKKNAKLFILHAILILTVFSVSVVIFNSQVSGDKASAISELANSSYPVMEIGNDICNYNVMSAYQGAIDLSLVRNQITVVDNSKEATLRLHNYNYDITAIQYILFDKDVDEPLEEGTLNKLKDIKSENVRQGTITFTSDLKQGKNYYLRLSVRLNNSTQVYFYTKIQNGAGYNLDEYLAFTQDFHSKIFDKSAVSELASYLEATTDSTDTSLEKVDINSSSDQITFGSMEVKQESQPKVKVKELNDTYAVIELDTILSTEIDSGVVQYYDLCETYKMRYTAERMYLLEYNRTMDAYYNESIIDAANNYISLGIQNGDNVDYISANEGKNVCFVSQGQLWYYNYEASDVSKVYSLSSENLSDIRNDQYEHGIKLLNMDKDGNITYLVYGYINRGKHEGANGIQIMRFDAQMNCNEELSFLSTSVPYDTMKEDIEKLSYLNKENIFYCIIDGDLHSVDLKEKKDTIMESGLVNDSLTASKDQSIIAIEEESDLCDNIAIDMIDLDTGKRQRFSCEYDSCIRSIGFLDNDFIYGITSASNVTRDAGGKVTFPISKIHIMDIDGKEVRSYQKKGRYIIDTNISGSILQMSLAKKSGDKFKDTGKKDYIRYKETEEANTVTLTYKNSSVYGTQLYLKFPNYIYIQIKPDLILSKIMTNEDDVTLHLEKSGAEIDQYYVYADGRQQAVYTTLPEAVKKANEARGTVIDSSENVLWQCIFADYAQVVGMDKVEKVDSDMSSLAGCLSMLSTVNGKSQSAASIDATSDTVENLIAKYSGQKALCLTGCTTDEILYYVSQGSPVLAKYTSSRYVIIMSYNSTKIRYLDPVTGQSTALDRTVVTDALEKAGNVFFSYQAK